MIQFRNFTRSEMLAFMAANSPNPSQGDIDLQRQLDRNRNPYNDPPPKFQIRSVEEIVAQHKLAHAQALMNAVDNLDSY